ncbi:adenylate cyclase-like protein [Leptomonas seymouri]|uniref:Adenylate cyclase-like protein n=1 Tax=Leptomonas seymouri TaxID=5684 RepID=A0A0N0P6A1_LEPSE|nr:adenylate cyclase-like protein [Leptomonas seymouri]|eukprot:KPI87396.1 adenylate cyclase-like protein [Leptomonas seymouri]
MGGAVSMSASGVSTRRRYSCGSRRSRTSLPRSTILEVPANEIPPSSSQQHRLCSLASIKSDVRNDASANTSTTTPLAKGAAQEPSSHIMQDHCVSSNTINSLPANQWDTKKPEALFTEPMNACRVDTPPKNSLEINVHSVIQKSEGTREVEETLKAKNEVSLTRRAPPTTMRHNNPRSLVPRSMPWTVMSSFDETAANATTTNPASSGFSLWGLHHADRLSSTECTAQSKAVIATSNFKATHQRLFEELRSRGNIALTNEGISYDSSGLRSSRGEHRTNSTRPFMAECRARTSADNELQRSKNSLKEGGLPQFLTPDATVLDQRQQQSPLPFPSVSSTADNVNYTPLRMRFSAANSSFSDPPSPAINLQRAITAVDAYASHMRQLLTSWQDIVSNHFDAFAVEMGAVLASQYPTYSCCAFVDTSVEDYAHMMLRMVDRAVPLVSQMEDMYEVLLEIGAMHRRADVGAGHFEALHRSFMKVLPHYVPTDQCENLCEVVWEPFWQLMVKLLSQGSRMEHGSWYAAQRRAKCLAEAQAVLEAVSEQQRSANCRGSFVSAMLDRAEAVNPAMAQLSAMREPRTAIRFLEGLLFVALQLDDDAERVRSIEQLAYRYLAYGLSEWGLRELRQPFIDTGKYYANLSARPDVWTPTAAESLGLFWDMLAQHWTEGPSTSRHSLGEIKSPRSPSGLFPFCMLITEIEASSRLWELHPFTMADAVDAHNRIIRKLIADHNAYEVKADSDSFAIASKDVFTALQIAVSIQLELMRGPIAEAFRMVRETQGGGLSSCWRSDSLRVRIGIHYCTDATAVYDSVKQRFDYYGPSVNCATLTAAAAAGGQILITKDAMKSLWASQGEHKAAPMPIAEIPLGSNPMDSVLDNLLEFQWWCEQRFRGIDSPMSLYSVLPMRLSGRTFPYYVGSRKVRVSAPSDMNGRREVHRLSLAQLKMGDLDASAGAFFC